MTYKTQHDYVSTYTGKKFHFLNPQPDEIDLEDIIHALSLICRYNGAVKHHYSVLSHSINVCAYVYEKTNCHKQALAALCHDFSEAYITDIPRPIKPYLNNYMDIEANITKAINDKFGIPEMTDFIHYVDKNIVRAEVEALFLHTPEWVNEYDVLTSGEFVFGTLDVGFEKIIMRDLFDFHKNQIAFEQDLLNLHTSKTSFVHLPSDCDENGNYLYDFELNSLHNHLGFTWKEYCEYVTKPSTLKQILERKLEGK